MTINQRIINTLKHDDLPTASPDWYEGDPHTVHITFNYNTFPTAYYHNRPTAQIYNIQVHLFAPVGTVNLAMRQWVCAQLCAAGTTYPTILNASDAEGTHYVFECACEEAVNHGLP